MLVIIANFKEAVKIGKASNSTPHDVRKRGNQSCQLKALKVLFVYVWRWERTKLHKRV
jgi:hypothetical protein